MSIDIWTDSMQHAELFGKPVLFTNWLVQRDTIPQGWHCYDLRGTRKAPNARITLVDQEVGYQEVDLKQERFVYDPETKTAHFIPGREDSYERLVEDEKRQFSNEDPTPEEHLMRSIENELLRQAVALLKEDERQLILLRFWQECSQSQVAELLGLSQQAVSYRERNILGKIKKFLKK